MCQCVFLGEHRPGCDLDALDGIQHVQPKPSVKRITSPNFLKRSSRFELIKVLAGVREVWEPEGMPIGAEAIVTDHSQALPDHSWITNQAPV